MYRVSIYFYAFKMWNVNAVMSLLQGVDGKDGDPGPAGEKGDKVRLMNVHVQHSMHHHNKFITLDCFYKPLSYVLLCECAAHEPGAGSCLCDFHHAAFCTGSLWFPWSRPLSALLAKTITHKLNNHLTQRAKFLMRWPRGLIKLRGSSVNMSMLQ